MIKEYLAKSIVLKLQMWISPFLQTVPTWLFRYIVTVKF